MTRSHRFLSKIFVVILLLFTGFVLVNSESVAAALQFNQTLSLTAGFPGDLPNNTRVAYNSRHNEYLVVYQYHNSFLPVPDQIHAARLSASGQYLDNYFISDLPNSCIQPDVAYDPLLDRYLVVWSYDTANDGSGHGWDVYGRFVPWSGPSDTLSSFEVAAGFDEYPGPGVRLAVDEKNPRIAYGSQDRTFFVVMEAVPIASDTRPYITGTKVEVSGANVWQNLTIRVDNLTATAHPDVAYDSLQDEFLVVHDNAESIYGLFVAGQETVGVHQTVQNFGTLLSELTPGSPFVGTHERPAVAFSEAANFYLITWVTNRHIDAGDLWVRYYPGRSAPSQLVVHLEQLDTGDPVNLADVDCGANEKPPLAGYGADCLVTWSLRHNNDFLIFGRQISLLSDNNGSLLGHTTGYFGPLANVGPESTWATDEPYIGVASGVDNFCPVFNGFDSYSIKRAFVNMSASTQAEGWSSVATGGNYSLGIRSDGSLWAWGYNANGQLGLGNTKEMKMPTRVGSFTDWVAVSAGNEHSLGIRTDGSLWAWGYNNFGQLGLGNTTAVKTPTRVGEFTDWVTVSAGNDHSLGIRSDGSLYGWGHNSHSSLGLGDSVPRNTPDRVGSFNDWISVSAGLYNSLGIRVDGSLWAWGNNTSGQLGLGGDYSDRSAPVQVGSFNDWITVDTSMWDHSLGIRAFEDGALYVWGGNFAGQLGLGDNGFGTGRDIPTRVDANLWDVLSAGSLESLAIRSDGSLWAWGNNANGQLGVGDFINRNTPNRVGAWDDWIAVEAGNVHNLGIRADGTLWAWGNNTNGQLGVGDITDRNEPTQVIIRSSFPWPMFLPAIINNATP